MRRGGVSATGGAVASCENLEASARRSREKYVKLKLDFAVKMLSFNVIREKATKKRDIYVLPNCAFNVSIILLVLSQQNVCIICFSPTA